MRASPIAYDAGMEPSRAGAGRVPLLMRLAASTEGPSTIAAPRGASQVLCIAQGNGGNGRPNFYQNYGTHLVGGGGGGGGCYFGPCSPADAFICTIGTYNNPVTVYRNGVELCAGLAGTNGNASAAGIGGGWRGMFGINGGDAGKTPTSDGSTNGLIPGGKWSLATITYGSDDYGYINCGGGGAPAYLGAVAAYADATANNHNFGAGGSGGQNGATGAVAIIFY